MKAKFKHIEVTAGEGFKLVFEPNIGGDLKSATIPAEKGFPLAVVLLTAAQFGKDVEVKIPSIGGIVVTNLEDCGGMLLAFYPGPLVNGADELLKLLGLS